MCQLSKTDKGFFHFPRKKVEQSATMRTGSRRATQKNQQKSGAFLKMQIKNKQGSRGRAYRYPTDHTRDLKGERFPPLEIPPYIPKDERTHAHAHAVMCFHAHAHEHAHVNPILLRSKLRRKAPLSANTSPMERPMALATKEKRNGRRRSRLKMRIKEILKTTRFF